MSTGPVGAGIDVVVGVLGRAHGIRGDVVVEVRTDEPERRFAPGAVVRLESGRELVIGSGRRQGSRWIVSFAAIAERTAVEELRGQTLWARVDPDEAPARDDEYYDRQLIGVRVLDHAGRNAGTITAVVHFPAQDLLEIDAHGTQRLVPFVRDLVPTVDLAAGTVTLADVPGLLDDLA
ncbi:MAG: ribosome maturation factor RimM [Arachnia sp.]